MKKFINKIVYGKYNFIFYFFWTTLKLKLIIRRPDYVLSYILYNLNYIILRLKSPFSKIPNIGSKNYQLEKIDLNNEFIKEVESILNNPMKYEFDKTKKKDRRYTYYQNYNLDYFNQVTIQADVKRDYFIKFLDDNFGDKIKKIYGNHNYRVEHFWLIKTLNKNDKETHNLNSNPHKDTCMPGALKIIIYLCEVDENNGPFLAFDKEAGSKVIKGSAGASIIFDPRNLLHAGTNTRSAERLAISFLIFPTLRKNLEILKEKPFFSDNSVNPFTKYI